MTCSWLDWFGCIRVGKFRTSELAKSNANKAGRIMPETDLVVVAAASSSCQSSLARLVGKHPTKSRYVDLLASLTEQVLINRSQVNDDTSTAERAGRNSGADWMSTSFEQSIFDSSCTFSLESFDNFMLEYPYLLDENMNVDW